MSPVGTALFTLLFVAVMVLLGGFYTTLRLSQTAMIAVTAVTAVVFVANLVREQFFMKKEEESD